MSGASLDDRLPWWSDNEDGPYFEEAVSRLAAAAKEPEYAAYLSDFSKEMYVSAVLTSNQHENTMPSSFSATETYRLILELYDEVGSWYVPNARAVCVVALPRSPPAVQMTL